MQDKSLYLPLNPFLDTCAGPDHVWGRLPLPDAPKIHEPHLRALVAAIGQAREAGLPQVRFIKGESGSGKSHLIARLRRACGEEVLFAYVAHPPSEAGALLPFVLQQLVKGLDRPFEENGVAGPGPTPLQKLSYTLLKSAIEGEMSLTELHDSWSGQSAEESLELVAGAAEILEGESPGSPAGFIRCLLAVLIDGRHAAAVKWLAGETSLSGEEFQLLNVAAPLAPEHFEAVLARFGALAQQAGLPLVLAIDQLDSVSQPAQIAAFQGLLQGILDQPAGWVLLVALNPLVFEDWNAHLDQRLLARLGGQEGISGDLRLAPAAELTPLTVSEQLALVLLRLDSPALAKQREKDGLQSSTYPFTEEDILLLTGSGPSLPRPMLEAASQRYQDRVNEAPSTPLAGETPAAVPDEEVPAQEEAPTAGPAVAAPPAEAPAPEDPAVEAPPAQEVSLPDSAPEAPAAELPATPLPQEAPESEEPAPAPGPPDASQVAAKILLLIQQFAGPSATFSPGSLPVRHRAFDGVDTWCEWGPHRVRVIATHASYSSLVTLLDYLQSADHDTVILRHSAFPVEGDLASRRAAAFESQGNAVHFLSPEEWAILDTLANEPAADAISTPPSLASLPVWQTLQRVTTAAKEEDVPLAVVFEPENAVS